MSILENPEIECICYELMVRKKRWVVFCVYRRPAASNMKLFFRKLSSSLNSALDKYDHVMITSHINIDTHDIHHSGYTNLTSFCDIYGLSNLVEDKHVSLKATVRQLTSCLQINLVVFKTPQCWKWFERFSWSCFYFNENTHTPSQTKGNQIS